MFGWTVVHFWGRDIMKYTENSWQDIKWYFIAMKYNEVQENREVMK